MRTELGISRTLVFFLSVGLFSFTAHRLPAPVVEETPPPTVAAKPKPKATRENASAESELRSSATRGFDGSWLATASGTGAGFSYQVTYILVIKGGKMADNSEAATTTLAPDKKIWGDMPEPYNATRTLYRKWKWTSSDLAVDGSNLRVRWTTPQLVDWSPKSIPFAVMQAISKEKARVSVYTLKGDQLTRDFDSQGGLVYNRMK